uniref:C2cd2 like n=1 Tax=Oryzias sinensis TaxID=183150 RepID=A0A8C8A386_9TELE
LMELHELSWLCLVTLFLASVLIVLGWLFQHSLSVWKLWRSRQRAGLGRGEKPRHQLFQIHAGGVWSFLLRLRSGRDGGPAGEAGVKGLLSSLFSFKSFREHWQRTWIKALNEQACRHGSSLQITFDSSLQLSVAAAIQTVTCTDQSATRMVLHCNCWVDTLMFPVTVTQQSPATVSMETYQVTTAPMVAKQASEGEADLHMIRGLIEDTLFSTQPAMVLNLKASDSSLSPPVDHLSGGLNSASQRVSVRRLILRQLRVTLSKGQSGELCCILSLDQPASECRTHFLLIPANPTAVLEWSKDISLELGPETKEFRIRLLERSGTTEKFIPGHASISLNLQSKTPTGQQTMFISPGNGLAPNAIITAEVGYGISLVFVLELVLCDSPLCSPSMVEVNDKKTMVMSDGRGSSSPNPSKSSRLSNGLDPVAETAIRQLTESACKVARRTPTKKSTLIISGVSKIPLTEDNCTLSSDYAAAMDAAMHGNHCKAGHHQDLDETTPSDVSERPSVEDMESDTGSAGGLETRSLKDHKVSFLQSGTKLWFRKRHREKDSSLSQSHENISNMSNFTPTTTEISRKKSGSFSRRLIKRFSFRSSAKSKGTAPATNGGASAVDN